MPLDYAFLPILRERIELAREIDRISHTQSKAAHDDAWIRNLAKEAEMDLSDEDSDFDGHANQQKGKDRNLVNLKAQLSALVKQPLRAKGISFKYITGGSSDFLQSLLGDTQHDKIIGVEQSSLHSDLTKATGQDKPKRPT